MERAAREARVVGEAQDAFADPDIDLVVIAAPNAVHASLAQGALAQGKHVVVDKPFTVTLQEARDVVACAQKAQRIVSVFQNRRWDSDFLTLQQLMANGRLGEVVEFHSHFDRFRPTVAERWRESDQPGAGLWYDLGPHLLDQALQLFGMPLAISADIALQRDGARAADYFHVLLRYPRLRVVLHAGALVAANSLRFAVHGTRASYVKHGMDAQEDALRNGFTPGQAGWGADPRPGLLYPASQAEAEYVESLRGDYVRYYALLRDAIWQQSAPPVTTIQALEIMQLLEWGIRSSRDRCEVVCG